MQVYISSTPEELEPHRAAARDVARDLGLEPVLRDPTAFRKLDAVAACAHQVAAADLLLAIVGWCRGSVPMPEAGGDGLRFWAWWEVESAFDHGKPVVVLMAGGSWRPAQRESDPRIHAVMRDFRGELDRVAVFFEDEDPGATKPSSLPGFRELVRRELSAVLQADRTTEEKATLEGARLRHWPSPQLPERPYPLLLPYAHPELLAGRERELRQLRQTLSRRLPIVGLHAPSGTGKSSLLAAALVPRLRAEGRPVAFDRHPAEPGLAGRLLDDLLTAPAYAELDRGAFIDRLLSVRRLAKGDIPLLVLDQCDDLLRNEGARLARATIGQLLAASVQRLPGLDGPPCQWLLAYRRELHGEVLRWLSDVLKEARAEGLDVESLPHELSRPERFCSWPLPPLAAPEAGSEDAAAEAAQIFREVIEKPLALTNPDGVRRYPWHFAPGHAARLGQAFGKARAAQPEASLVPELQVVLAHLLVRAGQTQKGSDGASRFEVRVPEEADEMIDRALEEHLRHALEVAYPATRSTQARLLRTRALLALRELADAEGRRKEGLPTDELVKAIGSEVLEQLATPQTRLVVLEEHADGWRYRLAHDRLAELLVRLVDGDGADPLSVDSELLELRRFVILQSELFAAGEIENATALSAARLRQIATHTEVLLLGQAQRRWWTACREQQQRGRRRSAIRYGTAALVLLLAILGTWSWAERRARRQAVLEQVATGEPEAALATLYEALSKESHARAELLASLRRRPKPLDLLERGVGGVDASRRGRAVLELAELALPMVEAQPEDPELLASMIWAIDFFAAVDPVLAEQAMILRDTVLGPLRHKQPPPPLPDSGDPGWADIPAGVLRLERDPSTDQGQQLSTTPGYAISAFRMMVHEVTSSQLRRLKPDHPGEDEHPATELSWYEAYTYAAWLGGRLPTELEWEYAARAGCAFTYCRRDGREATIDEVAWWLGNSADPETREPSTKPIMLLEPNPWGLFDLFGNVGELCANWYSEQRAHDSMPSGPTYDSSGARALRGGDAWNPELLVGPTGRTIAFPYARTGTRGFRVVIAEQLAKTAASHPADGSANGS